MAQWSSAPEFNSQYHKKFPNKQTNKQNNTHPLLFPWAQAPPWEWSQAEATERIRRPNGPSSLGLWTGGLRVVHHGHSNSQTLFDNTKTKSHRSQLQVQELPGTPALTWGN